MVIQIQVKHVRPDGTEYWLGRELYPFSGYSTWQRFETTITRAQAGHIVEFGETAAQDHFNRIVKLIEAGKGAQRNVPDWELSRDACYRLYMNADGTKPEIAAAQLDCASREPTEPLSHLGSDRDPTWVRHHTHRLSLAAGLKRTGKHP